MWMAGYHVLLRPGRKQRGLGDLQASLRMLGILHGPEAALGGHPRMSLHRALPALFLCRMLSLFVKNGHLMRHFCFFEKQYWQSGVVFN